MVVSRLASKIMIKKKIICAAAAIAASCLYEVVMSYGAAALNTGFRFRTEIVRAPLHPMLLSFLAVLFRS